MTPAGSCALPVGVICLSPSLHTHSCVCCEVAVPLPPSLPSPLDQGERENCKNQILRFMLVDTWHSSCSFWQMFFIPPHPLFLLSSAQSWPPECFHGYGLVLRCPSSLHHCQVSNWPPAVCDFQPIPWLELGHVIFKLTIAFKSAGSCDIMWSSFNQSELKSAGSCDLASTNQNSNQLDHVTFNQSELKSAGSCDLQPIRTQIS